MKKIHRFLGTLTITALILSSCKKDEVTPTPSTATYTVPTSYDFKNTSNISTIDFSGQKVRLVMLDEISTLMGGTSPVTEATLLDMYNGTGFTDASLNTSGKKLSDKTAASVDYFSGINAEQTSIRNTFKAFFKDAELI